jgi:hypothetical protein
MFPTTRTLAVSSLLLLAACGGTDSGPLSPARNLSGTWKTVAPARVYFDTDFCTYPDPAALGVTQDWAVTWVITPGATDNAVNVQMSFGASNTQRILTCSGGTGVVPEVSPMSLTGNVSSTTLTLFQNGDPFGTFTFTTDNLQGDMDWEWCMVYCQRDYTQNRSFILLRQ